MARHHIFLVNYITRHRTTAYNYSNAMHTYTLWTEKNTSKCFCHISHKTRPILINLVHIVPSEFVVQKYKRFVVFHLARIMSQYYLQRNRQNTKRTKMFLSYLLQNEADSDKVWYIISVLDLP